MNNVIKLTGLLFSLYIVLFLIPNLCMGGIRIYFTVGFVVLLATWAITFKLLSRTANWPRFAGTLLTAVTSIIIWIVIAAEREIHVLCW